MFERYTERARRAIFFARYEASQFGSQEIEELHLLLGLARGDSALLRSISPNLTLESLRERISEIIPQNKPISTSTDLPLSSDMQRVLTRAAEDAESLGQQLVDTKHLLLGMMDVTEGSAGRLMKSVGVTAEGLYRAAMERETGDPPASNSSTIRRRRSSNRTVEVRGGQLNVDYIRYVVTELRRIWWHWRRQKWAPRDVVVSPLDGRISFDLTLATPPTSFALAKGGWERDLCVICQWPLTVSDDDAHGTGYTNGRDWLCISCFEKFLDNPGYFPSDDRKI
jgi:hypothetical protein